ncbi:hypothetical protein [Absidia glauca]|uniref:Uncharacterized protein n=1 Tax=Absidia glauca TaxID=4829 RepID=A0A168PIM0_ABSGL|nr:hypothetical protein [Absidia glauca]
MGDIKLWSSRHYRHRRRRYRGHRRRRSNSEKKEEGCKMQLLVLTVLQEARRWRCVVGVDAKIVMLKKQRSKEKDLLESYSCSKVGVLKIFKRSHSDFWKPKTQPHTIDPTLENPQRGSYQFRSI